MFTGIVKGIGIVVDLAHICHSCLNGCDEKDDLSPSSQPHSCDQCGQEKRSGILRYAIAFPKDLLDGLETGASVSIDGVCQTVVKVNEDGRVWFDAIEETLAKTTLQSLAIDREVNLERAARVGDEIGGHLLSGHIYGTATISKIDKNILSLKCPLEWMKYLFPKGFIAIDGVSLTLVEVHPTEGWFTVHMIPETLIRTILSHKKPGDRVNIEFDALTQMIVETVERFMRAKDHF